MKAFDKVSRFILVALALSLLVGCSLATNGSNGEPQPSDEDTAIYGTYDCWGYSAASGWIKIPNRQLVLSATSLTMAGTQNFPSPNPNFKNQKLHSKDGQIWMEAEVSGTQQLIYLFDYYLQDATAYGTPILWLKGEYTSTATITSAPDPATALASNILAFVPVGKTPGQQPPSTKSVYAFGYAFPAYNPNDVYHIAQPYYWKDNVPIHLDVPTSATGATAFAGYFVNNRMYITGGGQDSHGEVSEYGYWEDGVWHGFPGFEFSIGSNDSDVKAWGLFTGTDIYLIGRKYSDQNGGVYECGYYKNEVWYILVCNSGYSQAFPTGIVSDGSNIYICGICRDSSNKYRACFWKNGHFNLLEGTNDQESQANSITISGSDVYIAGKRTNSDGVYSAGYWKNGLWQTMTTGENFRSFYSIIIDGNDVYRAYCDSIDSVGFHSGYFKNTVEHQLPILDGAYPAATSILKSDNDLYLSGIYIKEQAWEGGYWKNDEWHKVALPSNLQSSIVYSVVVK
jgi:hypothetical protein